VDEKDLVVNLDPAVPLSKTAPVAGKILDDDDLSALFGLDMAAPESPSPPDGAAPPASATPAKETPAKVKRTRADGKPAAQAPVTAPPKAAARKTAEAKKAKTTTAKPAETPAPQAEQRPRRRKRGAAWDPADIYKP
jgi:hypothetical protein